MYHLFICVIAISLALLVGKWGSTKEIGFGWAFSLSLFNLLVGIIVVACSPKKSNQVIFPKNAEK